MRVWMWATLVMAAPPVEPLRATELPLRAHALREAGVPESEVVLALDAAEAHALPADAAADALAAAEAEARSGGAKDNLGRRVQEHLKQGLRGRELAEAIHNDQAERGQGKPPDTPGRGASGGGGKPEGSGGGKPEGVGGGKPEGAGGGNPEGAGGGKPEGAGGGKPEGAGGGKPEGAGGGKPKDR